MPANLAIALYEIAWDAVNRHHAMQRVPELAAALSAAAWLGPCTAAEIGCHAGGTLWAWQQLGAQVFGITLPAGTAPGQAYAEDHMPAGAMVRYADSHDLDSVAWLRAALAGLPLDLLHVDGDHTQGGCAADVADYGPLVRAGGLILVNDIYYSGAPGVARAWASFEARWPGQCRALPGAAEDPAGFGVITVTEGMFDAQTAH